jgi:hypothetical protein
VCTLIVYPGPSGFPKIMNLKVVFQIFVGSIKMMGTRGMHETRFEDHMFYTKMTHLSQYAIACIKIGKFLFSEILHSYMKYEFVHKRVCIVFTSISTWLLFIRSTCQILCVVLFCIMYFLVSPLQINIHLDVYADVPNAQLTIKKTPNCSYWSMLLAWRKSTPTTLHLKVDIFYHKNSTCKK